MTARRTIIAPIVAMASVSLVSAGLAIGLLYRAAIDAEQSQLAETVQRRARLIGDLVSHDASSHADLTPGELDGTSLSRALEAYRYFGGFGRTGELALARPAGENFVFLLGPCPESEERCSVGFAEEHAEPMRRALRGEKGTMVGPDYRGTRVLAAYAPIEELGWGAVVKVNLAEIQRPFATAAALAALAALLAILSSAYLFFRPTTALVNQIRESETRLRTIVETAVEGIITAGATGRIESINTAAEQMFGYSRDQIVGNNLKSVIPDFDPRRFVSSDGAATREATGQRQNATSFPVEISKTAVQLPGQVLLTVVVRDITARKKAEHDLQRAHDSLAEMNRRIVDHHSKLIQTAKLSSIGLLAAGVAHEINNPLGGVKACVKALDEERVPEGHRDEYFQTAREGLDRIQKIVRGLLNYAKEHSLATTQFDAADVVSASLSLVAPACSKKNLEIANRIQPGEHLLSADLPRLTQALVNIMLNAIHASPPGSQIELCALRQNGRLGLRVADHGPGIPEENLSRVCDPFFTTKPVDEGTGLGLAVTDGIVRAHEGELVIDSVGGSGTSVTIWLPSHAEEPVHEP